MTALPTRLPMCDCWNTIGVRGDRSCPELVQYVHCQNCPVFAAAGRRFLDAPSPPGYLYEWTERLAAPAVAAAGDVESVLLFRLGDEWLALPVRALAEVTTPRPIHRVPFRGGLIAGLVNIRGELALCVHLTRLLGIEPAAAAPPAGRNGRPQPAADARPVARLVVARRDADRWVFPVDAVEKVTRVPGRDIGPPPATVGRAAAHLTRGVFPRDGRSVGLLDDGRLFDTLRGRLR